MAGPLSGRVAIVTGASRGVGKGVALSLGEAGATVYVTGRTVEVGAHPIPGTLPETAAAVSQLGGCGIALSCDHRDDAQVAALFRRVQEEQGRLDVLVNSTWPTPTGKMPVGAPFWELLLSLWDDHQAVGLRAHLVACWYAAPLLIARGHGLIVEISSPAAVRPSSLYMDGVTKAGQHRLVAEMARALRPHTVAVVALWPGYVRSEKNAEQPDRWPKEMMERFEKEGESPQFSGRAVAALAADPDVMQRSGQALSVGELAVAYDFTDVDGRRPDPWAELLARLRQGRSRP